MDRAVEAAARQSSDVGSGAITSDSERSSDGGLDRGDRWWGVPPALIVVAVSLATSLALTLAATSRGGLTDAGFDPYSFGEMGKSVAHGNWFDGFGNLIHRRAPLYPLVIGLIYVLFGDHARLVLFVQCLLFVGTALVAFDLARRHFNQRTGLIAGILCSLHPLLLRYVPTLHLETFLTFLATLLVWCTYRFWRQPTVLNGALVGLVAGLATLTKAVVLLYPAVFLGALLLTIRAARRRGDAVRTPWFAMVAMAAVMAATIAPWTIRNYVVTGHVVVVSSGTSDAFLRGFIFSEWEYITLQEPPYTGAEIASNQYFQRLAAEAGTVWERDDYETDQILNEEAKRRLVEDPGEVARKSVVGLFTFWYQLTSLKNSLLVLVCALGAWALAIVGWRRARREHRAVWPFLLPVFYLNVLLALLLALGRYSAPIIPSLLVVSAFGVDTLLDRRRDARE